MQVQESVFTFILNLNTIFMKTKFTPPHENSKILPIEGRFSIVKLNNFTNNRKQKNKNWFLKILTLVSMITVSQISYSQNTGWVMAPFYIKNTNGQTLRYNLPRPIDFFQDAYGNTNENNYNGEEGKSCGVFDNYGNLQ